MRITSLELHNIKSYAEPTRVDLTNGVNAICGPNGSGKTTVLEAIGFVLFDYLPYPQAAFLREGQKTGMIRLSLAGRDGREYEVVRRVGSGATHFVVDRETGTRIAERKDTLIWIREKALNIDGDTDLAALFKNAIGVPQGLMTADFQGAPSSRKTIFDPLLRVEEYRKAYEYLRDTVSYLGERRSQVDGEIAVLRSDVEAVPSREQDLGALDERVTAGEARLAQARQEKAEIDGRLVALDEVARRLQQTETDLAGAEYHVQRLADRVTAASAAVREAEEAREIVSAAEGSYHAVLGAREHLVSLNRRREERDRFHGQLQGAQAERKSIFDRIEELDAERTAAEDAAVAAAELVEEVARQEELERQQQELTLKLSGLAPIDQQISRLQQQVTRLQQECERRQVALARAREAEEQAAALPATQQELENVKALLAQLEPLRQRQRLVHDEGRALRTERDRLAQEVETLTVLRARLAEIEPGAAELEPLVLRQRAIQEKQAHLEAAVAFQDLARQQLERDNCPLLELACPAVGADRGLLLRLDEHGVELKGGLASAQREIAAIDVDVAAAAAVQEEARRLQVEAASLARSERELQRLEERLAACRREYSEISEQLGEEKALEQRRQELQARVLGLQAQERIAAERSVLEQQDQRDSEVLKSQCEELDRLEAERAELAKAEAQASEVAGALAALAEPRGRQQRLLAAAARKPDIERGLGEQQERLNDAAGRVKAYVGQLQAFEGLDDEIAAERNQEAAHAEQYERYLQYRALAGEVEPRSAALAASDKELTEAMERQAALARQRDEAAATYDAREHEEVRRSAREAGEQVVREQVSLEQICEQRLLVERELGELRRKAERLRLREDERDELVMTGRAVHFIRETIKSAGPAVTDSLLRNISAGANDIFAEIMDDHAAELRWDRDYEVLVQRGAETRKFAQLSGGEQMSAALAVRLALLKEMSEVDFAFFDEPTQNMDGERRSNLAGQISQVKGFDQLIVISHDDTFEHHTDNLIRLDKAYEETQVSGE
jgi:exonuclease SbcC